MRRVRQSLTNHCNKAKNATQRCKMNQKRRRRKPPTEKNGHRLVCVANLRCCLQCSLPESCNGINAALHNRLQPCITYMRRACRIHQTTISAVADKPPDAVCTSYSSVAYLPSFHLAPTTRGILSSYRVHIWYGKTRMAGI